MIKSRFACVALLGVVATVQGAASRPIINSVTVDTANQQLNISGMNLVENNNATSVLFNDNTLPAAICSRYRPATVPPIWPRLMS